METNEADGDPEDTKMNVSPTNEFAAREEPATKRTATAPQVTENERAPLPSIEEQVARIQELAQAHEMKEGSKAYIISNEWLQEVQKGGSKSDTRSQSETHAQSVVDNRSLLQDGASPDLTDEHGDKFYPMKSGLTISQEIEALPQTAWEQIVQWYGISPESPVITRYCHNTSTGAGSENLQYEVHPPVFTIIKLQDPTGDSSAEQSKPSVKMAATRSESFQKFLKKAKKACGIDMVKKVRVWRILCLPQEESQQNGGMITPAQSRESSPKVTNSNSDQGIGQNLILEPSKFAALAPGSQRELLEVKDETANEKYNGKSSLDMAGLGQEGLIVLEQQIGGPAGGEWISDSLASNKKSSLLSANGNTKSATASGRSSPAPQGMMTRGRAAKNGRARGTVGLGNLGNTCYMNSALQCVRSVKELTEYFLDDKYKRELNPSNPLGHNGEVAKAYGNLLKEIYHGGSGSSLSPRHFKQVIGKYGPSFSGYGQQDSQEFLLFLLDGLQEDLNRIHKKPYIEKPDSTDEMVHDSHALSAFADKCWQIYKARNDSVITDLFAGMYKSTVTCPVCDKVSIIFDPFNNLTLQLPIENIWSRKLTYHPLNLPPLDINVEIDKNASMADLLAYVAKKVGTDPKRLVLAEVYQNKFYKVYEPSAVISEERIQNNDVLGVFELELEPTNFPGPKRKKQISYTFSSYNNNDDDVSDYDTKLSEKLLVPVFHRRDKETTRGDQKEFFGDPAFITLDKEEAKDLDIILQKLIAQVASMTTRDILDEGNENTSEEDLDMVAINNDTDSSSDKVQASSIHGEEGMVDISMKGVDESSEGPRRSYPPRPKTKKPLPSVLQPGKFIDPGLRNLFHMSYFKDTDLVPTGWSQFNNSRDKRLPSLSSRLPAPRKQVRPKEQLRRALGGGQLPSEDEDDKESVVSDADDDDELPAVRALQAQTRAPQLSSRSSATNSENTSETDSDVFVTKGDEPLIRLKEAIVLEWRTEAVDALFGGTDADGMKGMPTWTDPRPVLPDPEQDRKSLVRKRRQHDGVSLDECLDEFGKEETLSENDAWYCPKCKEHRRASKKFELWKVPDILVIHLKRFSAQGRFRDKLEILVDFPTEGLDLSSRVTVQEEGKELIYDLFAVDNHFGGLGGGHYTAMAQNFNDGSWYDYNDSMASKRNDPRSAVTTAAYLLFYRRRTDTPLGGPFFEQLYEDAAQNPFEDSGSQSQSRNASPSSISGEGQRLDGYSRTNGSSSAYRGVAAGHQAGDGGSEEEEDQEGVAMLPAPMVTDHNYYDHDLPTYRIDDDDYQNIGSLDDIPVISTEADDNDAPRLTSGALQHQSWNFDGVRGIGRRDDDNASMNSSTAVNEDDADRSLDMAEWAMDMSGPKGTPTGNDDELKNMFEVDAKKADDTDEVAEIKIDDDAPSDILAA